MSRCPKVSSGARKANVARPDKSAAAAVIAWRAASTPARVSTRARATAAPTPVPRSTRSFPATRAASLRPRPPATIPTTKIVMETSTAATAIARQMRSVSSAPESPAKNVRRAIPTPECASTSKKESRARAAPDNAAGAPAASDAARRAHVRPAPTTTLVVRPARCAWTAEAARVAVAPAAVDVGSAARAAPETARLRVGPAAPTAAPAVHVRPAGPAALASPIRR
jgi:hypothetical protein